LAFDLPNSISLICARCRATIAARQTTLHRRLLDSLETKAHAIRTAQFETPRELDALMPGCWIERFAGSCKSTPNGRGVIKEK
jgi:hypothetical protein